MNRNELEGFTVSIIEVISNKIKDYYRKKGYHIGEGAAKAEIEMPNLNSITLELILSDEDRVNPADFSYLKFNDGKIYGIVNTSLIREIMKLPENIFPINVVEMYNRYLIEQN